MRGVVRKAKGSRKNKGVSYQFIFYHYREGCIKTQYNHIPRILFGGNSWCCKLIKRQWGKRRVSMLFIYSMHGRVAYHPSNFERGEPMHVTAAMVDPPRGKGGQKPTEIQGPG